MKKLINLIISIAFTFSCLTPVFAQSNDTQRDNYIVSQEITREEYINALAQAENITYEQAQSILESIPFTCSSDETVKYKTVTKTVKTLSGGSEFSASVRMSAYFCYVYNRASKKAVSIQSVTSPYTFIYGNYIGNVSFSNSGYTTNCSSSLCKITTIGSFTFSYTGASISVGGDILSVTTSGTTYNVGTDALTLTLSVSLNDLS